MLQRLGHLFVIVALLAATGGHWAVLQSVAWTTMLAGHLRTESFEQAVTKTFDGEHPCRLCKVVSAGKETKPAAEFPTLAKRLEFTHAAARFVFTAPMTFWLQTEPATHPASLTRPPPLPPPRGLPV